MDAHATSFIELAGCRLRVMRGGAGPVLLLLHGGGGADTWLPYMEKLAQRFEVIVPEHPGFGGTEIPSWLDRVSDLANFYLDFLERLELRDVHLVGLSLGGWIAADLAVRNASRLASLTLVAAAGIHVPGVPPLDPFMSNDEQSIRDLFHDQKLADEAIARLLRPETEDIRLTNRLVVARLSWRPRFHDPLLEKWLHRIRLPTLIIWGENDRLFPLEYAHAYQRLIPGAAVVVLAQCGHLPEIEKADEFVAAVADFCAQAKVAA